MLAARKSSDSNLSFDSMISLAESADDITVDTEGEGMLLGFSICFDGLSDGFYFPVAHEGEENISESQLARLYSILASRNSLIFHNAMHDLRTLAKAGFEYLGKFYDTMLMAHWINEERMNYSLERISIAYGGKPKNMPAIMKHIIETEGWNKVPLSLMREYGANDAFITHQLFRKLLVQFQLEGFDGELWATEQVFLRDVVMPMIDLGVKLDTAFCVREYMKGMGAMEECKKELGFNPGSGKDLKKFIIDELGLPVVKHTKSCAKCKKRMPVASHDGPPSFDKSAMEEYDLLLEKKKDHRAQTVLRYRGWQKTVGSNYKPYMDLCDENGVLHPGYKLHGTKTHRLACEKPALQQIPKSSEKEWNGNLKKAFVAREGFGLVGIDYAQLQYRMTCAYAEQDDLLEIFNDPERDVFTEQAAEMAWLRSDVKTLVYLILFGGGANRASVAFGVGIDQGAALVQEFHTKYPNIKKISNDCAKVARVQKYVTYWTGQRRHMFPYFDEGVKHQPKYYKAFNSVIQGGEAEIVKRAMIMLAKEVCDENCRMVLQIHDEIVFEIKEGMEDEYIPKIIEVMERAPEDFCKAIGTSVAFRASAGVWGAK